MDLGELGARITRWLLSSALSARTEPGDKPDPTELVKLVHTSDLARLGRLPRYQDHTGITLATFKRQRQALREQQSACAELIQARADLAALDSDDRVFAGSVELTLPRSLLRGEVSIPLPPPAFDSAVASSKDGRCADGKLWARGGWRTRTVTVDIRCTSREFHAQRIAEARRKMADASEEQRSALDAFEASPFRAPVLFISHRWRSADHPDPDGETLAHLQEIGDAYLIVDYCAFPQPPFGQDEALHLEYILSQMSELMRNVVVLHSADYLSRGWCVYEYLSACLKGTLVCDEIRDPLFIDLHAWSSTRAPLPADLFRDGISGLKANFIQESVLHGINRLLPQFKAAAYTQEADRARVRRMLRDQLLRSLPARREHQPYLSETLSKPWTAGELDKAFNSELQWKEMDTSTTQPFNVTVSASLREGAQRGFARTITPSSEWETLRALSSLRPWFGQETQTDHGPDLGRL